MQNITWISQEVIRAIHRRHLAEHGGSDGVRDEAMLESVLARPRDRFAGGGDTVELPQLAAAYAWGIVRSRPFLDGNTRTALVVCRVFLLLNGFDLTAPREARYRCLLALADGSLNEDAMAMWLRDWIKPPAPVS